MTNYEKRIDVRKKWLAEEANIIEGITYEQCGDYLYPALKFPKEENYAVGIWGIRHGQYLKKHKKVMYYNMLTSGSLNGYLAEISEQADDMKEKLIDKMKSAENITEELKAKDMMAWVQAMNSIRNRAEEIVYREIIYK